MPFALQSEVATAFSNTLAFLAQSAGLKAEERLQLSPVVRVVQELVAVV